MVKRSLKVAEGFFAVVGVMCTMYFIVACLMPEATTCENEEEDLDYDYVDPNLEDDDEDDDVPEDDGK